MSKFSFNKLENEKVIYLNENLLRSLSVGLENALSKTQAAISCARDQLPEVKINDDFLLLLFYDSDAVEYLCNKIKTKYAQDNLLACGDYFSPSSDFLSAEMIDNRRYIERHVAKYTQKIRALCELQNGRHEEECKNFATYLRVGAIYITPEGIAAAAPNTAEIFKDYCSVTITPGKETDFFNLISKYINGVKDLQKLHEKISDSVKNPYDRADIQGVIYQYGRLRLAEGLRVESNTSIWRAVLSYIIAYRKKDAPRFYNSVGVVGPDVETDYKLTGYLPAPTPWLRVKYPELYKNIDYRGRFGASAYAYDNEETERKVKGQVKNGEITLTALGGYTLRGPLERPEKPNCTNGFSYLG